ncbi:hypothetical protein BGX38DRAFT_108524 [Terfezia claveryi]|nr:hypothetical protein BGX38DRAFT_108524 [Terfezia claveryi]
MSLEAPYQLRGWQALILLIHPQMALLHGCGNGGRLLRTCPHVHISRWPRSFRNCCAMVPIRKKQAAAGRRRQSQAKGQSMRDGVLKRYQQLMRFELRFLVLVVYILGPAPHILTLICKVPQQGR